MATRKKAKGKTKGKRKKSSGIKAATRKKDCDCQRNRHDQKEGGEQGAAPANITQDAQADR
jgi:hypothetical protein